MDTKLTQAQKTLNWSGIPTPATNEETLSLLARMGWVWLEEEQVWDKVSYRPEYHVYNEF